jgi:uncharacterized short protein YbdD (DUF466 family)
MTQVKSRKEKGRSIPRSDSGSNFLLLTFYFLLGRLWWWLRQFSGDAAYENYLASLARRDESACCGHERAVSREEFYLESLRRRYSGVSRCC